MTNAAVQYVSQGELEALLIRVRSAKAVGIVALTSPSCFYAWKNNAKPGKKNGLKGQEAALVLPPVLKQARVSGMSCFEYLASRNRDNARVWAREVEDLRAAGDEDGARALEQKGPEDHELQARKDSRERIEGTPFVRNAAGFLYLQMMIPTGANPAWHSGEHEKSYVYGPYVHACLTRHYEEAVAKGKQKAQAALHEALDAPTESIEYSLKADEPNSLHAWLKPYKRSEKDPVDFNYREYRTDHILEVRHEGVRYIVKREGYEADAA